MRKNKKMFWNYTKVKPKRDYIDPRIIVARHIGWQKLFGDQTYYSVPEPDNYNRAVLTIKPVECKFIEDQVIYKDANKGGWITLMYVPDEQLGEYDAWLNRTDNLAYWQHIKAPVMRYRKDPVA